MSQTTAELLHAINDQVTEYKTVTGAGKKAGIARRISSLETDLVMSGVIPGNADQVKDKTHPAVFVPWENPTAARSTRTAITETELRSDIVTALAIMFENMPGLDTRYPETIRAGADTRVSELLKKASVREYLIPDPRKVPASDASAAWVRSDDGSYVIRTRTDKESTDKFAWTRTDGVNGPAGNALTPVPPTAK